MKTAFPHPRSRAQQACGMAVTVAVLAASSALHAQSAAAPARFDPAAFFTGRTTSSKSVPRSASNMPLCTDNTVCALGLSCTSPIRKLRRSASARACGLGT